MYATRMREADIAARIERLVGLSAGFAKEIAASKDQRIDPSLRRETQDYLAAIKSAQDSVDRAWIALVKLKPKLLSFLSLVKVVLYVWTLRTEYILCQAS